MTQRGQGSHRSKAVDAPKVRYLTVDEIKRLIEFCPSEFRPMIQAPIYTGMRYGEVCALLVGDFNGESVHIQSGRRVVNRAGYR